MSQLRSQSHPAHEHWQDGGRGLQGSGYAMQLILLHHGQPS